MTRKHKQQIHRLQRKRRLRRQRRGVLMLVVLSLLVLFVLVAVAFVISASQQHTASKALARASQTGTDPARQLDAAMYQFVRDTPNPNSALRGHSLLGDMYGSEGISATISGSVTVAAGTQGQFLQFSAPVSVPNPTVGYFNGCVLTFTSGPARGFSTRIVGFDGASTFRVMTPFSNTNGTVTPQDGDAIRINGRPFNGTGFGYSANNLGTEALLPNRSAYGTADNNTAAGNYLGLATNFVQSGSGLHSGPDESYDAADYQNMHMSVVLTDIDGNVTAVIPSFHRPALTAYHGVSTSTSNHGAWMVPKELRGGKGAFNISSNPTPWHVDNDNDGVFDSVWIDLGFPAQQAANGTLYRPMFAFLCVDLDGKLNLNAHDGALGVGQTYSGSQSYAGGSTPSLPLGEGYGPAEVDLGQILGSSDVDALLFGAGGVPGRYGSDSAPGVSGVDDPLSAIKQFEYPANGTAATDPAMTTFHLPPDLFGGNAIGVDLLGAPLVDTTSGNLSVIDDPYELDLSLNKNRGVPSSASNVADSPFSPAELERVLRMFDADAGTTAPRLAQLAPGLEFRRFEVTTDSWDLPVPGTATPAERRAGGWTPHVVELLRRRLAANGITGTAANTQIARMLPPELINGERMDINRPLGNGRDDNGNNVPDDPAEASTETAWKADSPARNYPTGFSGVDFNHLNNIDGVSGEAQARQIMARQLYVLMMLLTDEAYQHPHHPSQTAPPDANEYRARRIAQWAVNVVDYRDADAIMTGFEYDVNPFNGWDVNGDLDTSEPDSRVVWGVEDPHAVLSETLAFHDMRLVDADRGGKRDNKEDDDAYDPQPEADDGDADDNDLDSQRIPQGSLFLEVLCTGSSVNPMLPRELYTATGELNLAALSAGGTGSEPVWRIAITSPNSGTDGRDENNLLARLELDADANFAGDVEPTSTRIDPTNIAPLGAAPAFGQIEIDRVIWFSNNPPATNADRIYYRRAGSTALLPGQYAVVGPRTNTYLGWDKNSSAEANAAIKLGVGTFGVEVRDPNNSLNYPTANIRQVAPIIVAADAPDTWMDAANTTPDGRGIGISVSEPRPTAAYYPEPELVTTGAHDADLKDTYNAVKDEPLDNGNNMPLSALPAPRNGTHLNYATALLQRLANPLLAHNATTNPYITVDFMPIDLTVFNGQDSEPPGFDETTFTQPWNPDDPPAGNPDRTRFQSRQRGLVAAARPANLWNPVSEAPSNTTANGAFTTVYKHALSQDAGHTIGYLNNPFGAPQPDTGAYTGRAASPFPWIAFANRPFVSGYELLNVPASSQGRLMYEFSMAPTTPLDPYDVNGDYSRYRAPFGHLLNFRETEQGANNNDAAHFYRLLDYVHVPSRFVGTDDVLNPATSAFGANSSGNGTDYYHPPFNRVSRFREPGKVNINTIYSGRIWNALLGNYQGPTTTELIDSRRGYGTAGAHMLSANTSAPTFFANPFRSAGEADLAPISTLRRAGVEATLLRSNAIDAASSPSNTPLFDVASTQPANNTDRNAYFRYQTLQKMGNLVTTRSNVYAVWITMGRFEVNPANGQLTGRELGADLGNVERHRAFYIIDRSIPVAFEPGVNHNVDKAILLRKFIE